MKQPVIDWDWAPIHEDAPPSQELEDTIEAVLRGACMDALKPFSGLKLTHRTKDQMSATVQAIVQDYINADAIPRNWTVRLKWYGRVFDIQVLK